MPTGRELPPIKLRNVGRSHSLRDGSRCVSVMQHYWVPTIKAYVWECQTDLLLEPGCNVDELLCSSAHRIQEQHESLNARTLCGPVARIPPGVLHIGPRQGEGR